MEKILLLFSLFAVCWVGSTESTVDVSNREFEVEKLFTDENGYTVHRFYGSSPHSNYHYYVTPGPSSINYRHGKKPMETINTSE